MGGNNGCQNPGRASSLGFAARAFSIKAREKTGTTVARLRSSVTKRFLDRTRPFCVAGIHDKRLLGRLKRSLNCLTFIIFFLNVAGPFQWRYVPVRQRLDPRSCGAARVATTRFPQYPVHARIQTPPLAHHNPPQFSNQALQTKTVGCLEILPRKPGRAGFRNRSLSADVPCKEYWFGSHSFCNCAEK